VVAIDPKKGGAIDEFHRDLARAGVADHVTPVVATSDDAAVTWQEPIRFLWIDGAHSYEQVGRDFRNWTPFLVDGGIVAFHDTYEWEGVRRVIDEEVIRSTVSRSSACRQHHHRKRGRWAESSPEDADAPRRPYWMNGREACPRPPSRPQDRAAYGVRDALSRDAYGRPRSCSRRLGAHRTAIAVRRPPPMPRGL
jgi:hypothetical protein